MSTPKCFFLTLQLNKVAVGLSSRPCLGFHDSGQLGLPLVAILDELLLVVEKLLVKEGRVFEVGALDDGVDRAGLLAEATEDALGHVDVVLGRTARAIRSRLTLNLDGKGRTGSFAKFAGDASLLTCGIPAERMLTSEHRTEWALLPRIVQHVIRLKRRVDSKEEDGPHELCMEELIVDTFGDIGNVDLVRQLIANRQTNVALVVLINGIEGVWIVILAICHPSVQVI